MKGLFSAAAVVAPLLLSACGAANKDTRPELTLPHTATPDFVEKAKELCEEKGCRVTVRKPPSGAITVGM